ncbi:nascent polypeptide-associated complex beta subunit [Stylosanthes scabra]|uniref:Nascent polypeptide-associated complex subunit beta n=1 Tax=Stylosanthes scabra TaxID=79078 RepID=A0ABU6Z315_9FABA|nr:nascent polypeptide-associated complex beta subunit [Stylosanthes scabra]
MNTVKKSWSKGTSYRIQAQIKRPRPIRENDKVGKPFLNPSHIASNRHLTAVGNPSSLFRHRLGLHFFPLCVVKMNREKLMKMAGSVRTGGKGTMRRKKKAVHKTTTTDDKRLQSTLKRIGVNAIPAIEEVNIFKDDVVIQFLNPKVQASIAANTWVVSGAPQTKKLQDILPSIIHQLGPDNLENLKKLAEQFQKQAPEAGAASTTEQEENDDDVPELVPGETFESAAEEAKA